MSTSEQPNPGLVFDLVNAFHRTAAIRAAVDLNLFSALSDRPRNSEELVGRCGGTTRGIRILCDFLAIHGVIEKDGEAYRHTPSSAAFLDPNSPHCVASVVHFLAHPDLMEPYNHLAEIIRQGKTVLPGEGTVEPDHPIWVDFANHVAPMMAPMTGPLGKVVLEGSQEPVRVLDIAAGHGLFGIEIAKQNPNAQIVAVDWPAVLEVATRNAKKAAVSDRYELKKGSAFDVDFEGPYDIILLTNFLHHFDPPTNTSLLKKCHSALAPNGRIAALEFVPNEDRISPPESATFAMIMLATTASGDAYTFSDYQSMFSEAGFAKLNLEDIPHSPHRIVLARK